MIDEIETPEEDELVLPDFLDRASPEVVRIVEAGRKLSLDSRKAELAKATAPATVEYDSKPKRGSATAMAAKSKQTVTKPENVIVVPKPKATPKVTSGKKTDAVMIKLIKEHRAAAGNTAGKTLKHIRNLGISCSQERFKGLYAKAS